MTVMRTGALLALTLMLVAPAGAAPRKAPPKPAPLPKAIQSCDAHKFETIVDTVVDGQPRKSRVKLCGNEGQSDAEWIGTMRDAVRKLEANKEMAAATRDQIITAIKAEIARLSIVEQPAPPKLEAESAPSTPISRDYAALPPVPPPPSLSPAVEPPATASTQPTAGSAQPVPAPVAAPVQPVAIPRLKFSCEAPSDLGGPAPCAEFERETRLTIATDGSVPAGTILQFVRNGRTQAELPLDGVARGASLSTGLPRSICAGFGAGRLELRVLRGASLEAVQTEGPYSLRC